MNPRPIRTALAGALLALSCAGAQAAPGDSRVVSRRYQQNEIVRVEGRVGVQATIGFESGEKIENVAVGDADRWQITPNRRADLLFVKPLEPAARTNMTVVTDRRTYLFDLVASPAASPVYMLTFTYGAATDAPAAPSFGEVMREVLADQPAAAPPASAPAAGAPFIDPALLNFAWAAKGVDRIHPSRVYDDGRNTYLLWGPKRSEPRILLRDDKGRETPANLQKRGNTVVLEGVPRVIVLRSDTAVATLENRNEPPAQTAPAPAAATPAAAAPAAAAEPVAAASPAPQGS